MQGLNKFAGLKGYRCLMMPSNKILIQHTRRKYHKRCQDTRINEIP